jgi:hypothetical protein
LEKKKEGVRRGLKMGKKDEELREKVVRKEG